MRAHDLLFVILAFFSEVLGTLSGFGSSTFFVPAAVLLEAFRFVLVLTAILHCLGNISKIFLFRRNTPKELLLRLCLPSIIFTGVGALLSAKFSSSILMRLLGIVLVFLSLISLFKKKRAPRIKMKNASLLCGVSGLLTGLVGTGGALRGITLSALQIEKGSFIALSAMIDLGGDLLRTGIYLYQGYMDWKQWFYIPTLGLAALLGAIAGKRILQHISQSQFEKIVSFFVLLSGIMMIFG